MPYSRARYGTRRQYAKFRRCVRRVKNRSRVKSPYAVCRAVIYKKKS